jgi:hypothetical protein
MSGERSTMSSETEATSPEPEGLQFDHAEFENVEAPAAVVCLACKQPIVDHYYEINGTIVCETCRERIEGHLRGGSGFLRFLKAIAYGTAASLAGAAIYFVVLHYLHIQAALVSILCGFMVGKAVHKASGGRGGWIYQILAILQTYLAIGVAYTASAVAAGAFDVQPGQPAAQGEAGVIIVKVIIVTISTVVSPILVAKEDLISLVIVIFALWEAWKFTRRARLVVTGPYRVGEAEPEDGTEGVAGHA